jgi:hypothetical protein
LFRAYRVAGLNSHDAGWVRWPTGATSSFTLGCRVGDNGASILGRGVMVSTISREQLKAKIDRHDPFILAEVLAPGQYERAHLPGAVNLPPDRVTALAATLLPDKHQEIVVYCGGPT